jgi:hypothetical protein
MNAWILRTVGLALVATGCSGDLRRASPCFAWAESVCKAAERCSVTTSGGSGVDDCMANLSDQCSNDYEEESLSYVEECNEALDGAECVVAISTLVAPSCQSVTYYGYRVFNPDGTEVPRPLVPAPFFAQ